MTTNRFYKGIAYIAICGGLSWVANFNSSDFFDSFNEVIIPLLATLLAINITTAALIAGELRKIQSEYPSVKIGDSKTEIKRTFKVQIFAICSLVILMIIKDWSWLIDSLGQTTIDIIFNGYVIACFCYFLEIIYDLGCALFDIINSDSSSNNKKS